MVTITLYKNSGLTMDVATDFNQDPINYLITLDKYTFDTNQLFNFSYFIIEKEFKRSNYDYCSVRDGNDYYYFFIDSFEFIRENKTKVNIVMDYANTYYNKFKVGDGFLIRTNLNLVAKQKYESRSRILSEVTKISTPFTINNSEYYLVYGIVHRATFDKNYIFEIKVSYPDQVYDIDWGNLITWEDFVPDNIINIWLSPFALDSSNWNVMSQQTADVFRYYELQMFYQQLLFDDYKVVINDLSLLDDPVTETGITDLHGNLIWTTQKETNRTVSLYCYPTIAIDTFKWVCVINNAKSYYENFITIPCENLSFYSDSYKDYEVLLKPFQKAKRDAQLNYEVAMNIGQMGKEGMNWTGLGIMKGSNPAIAAVTGIGGQALSTVVTYYATQELNNKLEVIENRQSYLQPDSLNSMGTSVTDISYKLKQVTLVRITRDSNTIHNHSKQEITVGNDYNYYINFDVDLKSYIQNNTHIQGRFIVSGIPIAGQNQIKSRLLNGLFFKSV